MTRVAAAHTRRLARYAIAFLFVSAGALHFAFPDFYLGIMPPYLPQPLLLVYASGGAEVAGGVGVLLPRPWQRWAGVGLVLLLLAVFPANVHMAREAVAAQGWAAPRAVATLARLPVQFLLVAVVWWAVLWPEQRPEAEAPEQERRSASDGEA